MTPNNQLLKEQYLKLKLEYELHNQNNDASTLSDLSFEYSTLLSLDFDELELLYGDDFESSSMYKSMLEEKNELYARLEERFLKEEIKNLELLKYFGPSFYLFEMNKNKAYRDEERASLISNSDYVDIDSKIEDLTLLMNKTSSLTLKQDIEDWINYKKACLDNFGNTKDDKIIYVASTTGYLSRELEPVLSNTFNGDIAAKTLMESKDDTTRRAGTIHMYEGKISNIFLSLKLLPEGLRNNSLNKYVCTLNLDVPMYTFIEAIENNPNNIVCNKRDITNEDLELLNNDDNPYWLLFSVEVVKTECSGFTEPTLLKTYSFEGFKILDDNSMTGKQRNYQEEYKSY